MSAKINKTILKKGQNKVKKDYALIYLKWGLVIFSFLLYVNTVSNSYNLDDELVTRNHSVTGRGVSALFDIFTQPYYTDESENVYEYRPIVLASFAIEHQLFGDNPGISHLINALLYSLLIFILFKVLLIIFYNYNVWLPLSISLLFASHPIHTEVVASIKNRDEILALTGALFSLLLAANYIRTSHLKYLFFSVLFFLLALLSKKSVLPFALIIPLSLIMFLKPGFIQIVILAICYAFLGAVSSFFFDINVRILFFISIIAAVLFFWMREKLKTTTDIKIIWGDFVRNKFYNAFTHDEDKQQQTDKNDYYITGLFFFINLLLLIMGFINNSRYILLSGFLMSTFFYLFSKLKHKDIFLFFSLCMSLLLLLQTDMVSPLLLFLLIFFLEFEYRKILHLVCIGLLIFPVFIDAAKYLIFIFNYLILALAFILIRSDKKYLALKIYTTAFVLILIAVDIVWERFYIESFFMLFIFVLLSVLSFSGKFREKRYYLKKIVLLIIPLAIMAELFFTGNNLAGYSFLRVDNNLLNEVTEIMPASGRGLDFAEMPINNETPMSIRMGTAFVAMAFYLKMLLYPHPLGFYYGYDMVPIVSITNLWALISVAMHLFFLIFALIKFHTQKLLSFGILYYLICISIFSNIIAPVAGVVAERLVFTASLGFCVVLALVLIKIFKIKQLLDNSSLLSVNKGFMTVLICLVFLYGFKTVNRNKAWKNHLSLFEADITYLKRSAQAHQLLASALIDKIQPEKNPQKRNEMLEKAITHYKEAVNIYPEFYNASYNLARTYFMAEKIDEAENAFEHTLKIDSSSYMIYMYLGIINDQKNNREKAIAYYRKTIEKEPTFVDPYTNLSALYMKENRIEEAISVNLEILGMLPDAYEPVLNLGKIYFSTRQLELAGEYFERAYRISDTDKNLVNALYEINKAMGNEEKASFYLNKLKMGYN